MQPKTYGGKTKRRNGQFSSNFLKNLITFIFIWYGLVFCLRVLDPPGITDSQELGIEPRFSEKAASVLKR